MPKSTISTELQRDLEAAHGNGATRMQPAGYREGGSNMDSTTSNNGSTVEPRHPQNGCQSLDGAE